MNPDDELALTIRVPEGASEVLVRLPAFQTRVVPEDVTVDFRPSGGGVWTPSVFFPDSVQAVIQ